MTFIVVLFKSKHGGIYPTELRLDSYKFYNFFDKYTL